MNPELDKLASAAIDGEATQAEIAAIANDSAYISARAELENASQFLAQAEPVSAPDGLAESQISIAMEAFRADVAQRTLKAAEPRSRRAAAAGDAKSSWSLPGWLTPALFSLVVLAGVGYAATNLGSSANDTASFGDASMEAAPTTTAAFDSDERSAETTEAAMAEDLVENASPADDAGNAGFVQPNPIDLSGAYFVSSRNLRSNDVAKLAPAPVPPISPETYDRCSEINGFVAPPGELVRVVRFLYDDAPAELLVFTVDSAQPVTLIVNDACEVLDQG